MGYLERDNYTPPSEDEVSLANDEFGVPEDPVEQVRFRRRLIATTKSLQRKQEQLKAEQDLLIEQWTKILATEKYGLDRPNKGHTRHNWLPQPKQENQRHTSCRCEDDTYGITRIPTTVARRGVVRRADQTGSTQILYPGSGREDA